MGFQIQVGSKSFVGAHVRAVKEEVSRKIESYVSVLQHSAEECEEKGVLYFHLLNISNAPMSVMTL